MMWVMRMVNNDSFRLMKEKNIRVVIVVMIFGISSGRLRMLFIRVCLWKV